ncbi:MAG: Rid family detoxifying hydrolase [Candidatus Bipolaricaulota bacterium]|nr:Rid family detoxifying hydrolase [Candidatus Bipolaricaulota bacterium]MDW8126303.1 Rid family detoxifying hydrolase [Candidatus Bipolaricaulota bacterium]
MTRRAVTPTGIHTLGPYSPAIRAGDFLFISGQIPLDPSGSPLFSGSIEAQTQRCLEQIKEILAAAGGTLRDLVKVTIYLVDMKDFEAVNRAYAAYFDLEPPARACVAVSALPKGARIEIEAVAYLRA